MKKKVLQINTVYGVGSTGRIAKDIGNVLKSENIESYIAYGYGNSSDENTIKIGTTFEYYFHNIMSRLFCMQGRFSYFATKKFLNEVDKINPDIIHLHNIHGNYINYKLLFNYIKEKEIPVIWTLHDCWSYTGKCTYYDAVKCNKWKEGCFDCPNLKEYPKSYFFDNSKNEYKNKKEAFSNVKNMTIVTPSKWLAEEAKKSYLKDYSILTINNGIDLSKFKYTESDFRKKYNLGDKKILLGVASEWTYRKGLDTFEKLVDLLDDSYQIVLIGLAQDQIQRVSDKIIKFSRTDTIEDLARWYSTADLFINPTIEDNFPTTNIESLACGTPVITYKTGGSTEIIDDGSGASVEKENIEELVKTIKNYPLKGNNNEECIRRSKEFDKNSKFIEYINLYKKILKQREE